MAESVPHQAVIVGASRGIGLAICEHLLDHHEGTTVCATARQPNDAKGLTALRERFPDRLTVLRCDTRDDADLEGLADQLSGRPVAPSLVLHAAGILHTDDHRPEKSLAQCERDWLLRQFEVNAIGPLLLARSLVPLMPSNRPSHFAALSAMVGSIGDNRLGGWFGYRASKAALNQFLKTLSRECRRTHPGLCVTAIHPGTTDTALSAPFQANVPEDRLYTPAQTAQRVVDVVLQGKPENSGRFMNWDGTALPW